MNEGRLANVSAALLVGGASTRMGRDKASLTLEGVALATRLARLLETLVEDVLLVGGAPPDDAPGRRIIDTEGPPCSLRGLVSALAAARAPRLLVIATDLPFITPTLLLGLLARPPAQAVVPCAAGPSRSGRNDGADEGTRDSRSRAHPLCAVYDVAAVLPVASEQLAAGRLALRATLDRLQVDFVEGEDLVALDPDGHALDNANTPEDWRNVEARSRAASDATGR